MKVFDFATIPYDNRSLQINTRIQGIMQYGFSWQQEMKAQADIVARLEKVLNNKYILLKNVTLSELGLTIPLILLGPQGVAVIQPCAQKGIFRAKEDRWETMDNRQRKFVPAKENLIAQTAKLARGFAQYLHNHGYPLEVNSILMLTNPGTHIETQRPSVRILLIDAITRFASRMTQSPPVMSAEDGSAIQELIAAATQKPEAPPKTETPPREPVVSDAVTQSVDQKFTNMLAPIQKRIRFTKKQWLFLGAFFIIEVLVLLGFLFFIVLTA